MKQMHQSHMRQFNVQDHAGLQAAEVSLQFLEAFALDCADDYDLAGTLRASLKGGIRFNVKTIREALESRS